VWPIHGVLGRKDAKTQQEVASGVYLYRLEVDGKPLVKKMLVSK
jgi:hypothetical protein